VPARVAEPHALDPTRHHDADSYPGHAASLPAAVGGSPNANSGRRALGESETWPDHGTHS
jgi:hypothetical protein